MGRFDLQYIDNVKMWKVNHKTTHRVRDVWGKGTCIQSIVKMSKLHRIVKQHGTVFETLKVEKQLNDNEIDAIFEEEEIEQERQQGDCSYLEQEPESKPKKQKMKPSKTAKQSKENDSNTLFTWADKALQKPLVNAKKKKNGTYATQFSQPHPVPQPLDKQPMLIPLFDEFLNTVHENGQEGKLGRVPVSFQKIVRRHKVDAFKEKVAESESYDCCRRFYSFLQSKGCIKN